MDADRRDETAVLPGWPYRAIADLAERQQALIERGQLLALGVSHSAIDRALTRGRLFRVHAGVYSLVPERVRPRWAAERAAVLAYGPGVVLSHRTALALHGIVLKDVRAVGEVDVTAVGRHAHASHAGTVVHQTATLHRDEHHRRNGLPVTSVVRTVIDLSPKVGARQRELLVDAALQKTSTKLTEALERHPGRPGTPAIRALLDPNRPSSITWSKWEESLRALLIEGGLPAPESNVPLTPRYTPDLLWRQQRLIVEYDSEQWHLGRRPFHDDRTRHNDLTAVEGYTVLRVTKEHTPVRVLVWVARALGSEDH